MIIHEPIDSYNAPPNLDRYGEALDRFERAARAAHVALIEGDPPARARMAAQLRAATDAFHIIRELESSYWIRGLRFAAQVNPGAAVFQLEELLDAAGVSYRRRLAELERRLEVVEDAAAESAVALEELGVTA